MSTRLLIVDKIIEMSDISGVSVEGDRETEQDSLASHQAEAENDAIMSRWQLVSSQLAGVVQRPRPPPVDSWPIVVLPVRNTQFIDRPIDMHALLSLIMNQDGDLYTEDSLPSGGEVLHPLGPSWRLPRYVLLRGRGGGEGKSELAKEMCHRLLESRTSLRFIAWLNAVDAHSLAQSYKCLAHRIRQADPSFCQGKSWQALRRHALQEAVNNWLTRLSVPWLLVVDNFDSSSSDVMSAAIPSSCTLTAVGATVLLTSRAAWLEEDWKGLLQKRVEREMQQSLGRGGSTSHSEQLLSQGEDEAPWLASARLHSMDLPSVLTADDLWRLCHEVLGREAGLYEEADGIEGGGASQPSDSRLLRSQLQALCNSLHDSPLGLLQAFSSCLEVYRYRRLLLCRGGRSGGDAFPISYVSRLKEYSNWLAPFHSQAETSFPLFPRSAGLHKAFLVIQGVACEEAGGRPEALQRCLELLAFLCPHSVDLRMLAAWLRPPFSPLRARISDKWSVSGKGGGIAVENVLFEIVVHSVLPVSTEVGQRFSWRVRRSYADFKQAHLEACVGYSVDMNKVPFPSGVLPTRVASEVLEDAVGVLRAQLSNFMVSLVESAGWRKVCVCPPIARLLGFSALLESRCYEPPAHSSPEADVYVPMVLAMEGSESASRCVESLEEDPFLRLVDPLFSLGLVSMQQTVDPFVQPSSETIQPPATTPPSALAHIYVSMSAEQQEGFYLALQAGGRLEAAIADATLFLLASFRTAHDRYKKECSDRTGPRSGKEACEELFPHVMNLLSVAATSALTESFELCSLAYHFAASEGLHHDAVFCATRCVEVIKDGAGSFGPHGEQDGLWHGYLADMLCRLGRGAEAQALYEHALDIFRTCCGSTHRHTLSVLERLGRLLFELGNGKSSARVLEDALHTARQLFGAGTTSTISSATAMGSANSLHIADRIDQLVRVLAADAPDSATVNRCLELKHEELEVLRRVRGEFSPFVAKCLTSIGELERRQGRTQKALACFEDSLDILARCVEPDSVELVAPLFNLAMELHSSRKYSEALRLYSRALKIKEKAILGGAPIDSNIASIHDSLGMLHSEQNRNQEALEHLQKACDMYVSLYGKENHQVAISLNNLASAWRRMGNNTVARALYAGALSALRRVGSRADEDVIATTLNALGELWAAVHNLDEARPLFVESLTIRVKLYGESHRDTIAVMKNLCSLYCSSGALEEAREVCSNALALQTTLSGPMSEVVADMTSQMADVYRRMGRLDDARVHYKRSVAILRAIHGNKHPAVALQLNNLASVLFSAGEYDDCELLYEESRKVLTAFHGKDHLSVASCLSNLGELHKHLGKLALALSFHEQSLDIRLRLLGPEHPTVGVSLGQVADVLRLEGSLDAAVDACSQCLGIRIKSFGMEHEEVVDSLRLLAVLMVEKGDAPQARRLLQDALRSQEKIDDERARHDKQVRVAGGTLETAGVLEAIGEVSAPADLPEKVALLEKSVRIRRALQGEEHPDVATALSALGVALSQRGDQGQAMELHRQAAAIREKHFGDTHPLVVASLTHIAECLQQEDRLEEAMSIYEQCVSSLRQHHSENHPQVAAAMMRLVDVLQLLEEYPTALTVCESALYINTKHFGESSAVVAGNLQKAADLRRCLNNPKEALPYFLKALAAFRLVSASPYCADVLSAMEGVTWAMEGLGREEEAAALRVEKLSIQRKVFGDTHPCIVQELNAIGRTLMDRGKYLEASDHFNRALDIGLVVHGEDHESIVNSLQGLASVLEAQGKKAQAIPLYERIRDIHKKLGVTPQALTRPATEQSSGTNGGLSSSIFNTFSLLLGGKME